MKEELVKDFPVFFIPENIGGRFSIFTAVGLLPLAFTGINIALFLEGITEIKDNCFSKEISQNISMKLLRMTRLVKNIL